MGEVTMRTIFLTLAVLGVLAAGGAPSAAVENPGPGGETAVSLLLKYKSQEKTLAKAMKLLKKHQVAGAEASLLKCLEGIPEHYEAHYLLALMEAEHGGYPAAVGHMERAEAELERLAGLCRAWQEEHAPEETAERELVSGEATKESAIQSNCRAAGSKVDTGLLDREVGIAPVSGRAPLDPRRFEIPAAYLFAHGNFLFKSRRWPEAAARYRLAVKSDPRLAAAWNNLLSALLLAGQGDEARSWLERAGQAGVNVNPGLRLEVEKTAPL
jgi:tetratricopeptide (TPR) repeat protein